MTQMRGEGLQILKLFKQTNKNIQIIDTIRSRIAHVQFCVNSRVQLHNTPIIREDLPLGWAYS